MRLLAVDTGTRRIGLAISDALESQATPLLTLEHRSLREDVARVAEMAARRGVGKVVVGLPLNMDGTEGPAAKAARRFAEELRQAVAVPVSLLDERLTTAEAERELLGMDLGRAQRRTRRDEVAAAILLEAYLAARKRKS